MTSTSQAERVIVVGSGPCGASAAARLVELGVPTVMLDAGLGPPRGFLARVGGRTIYRRKDWRPYAQHRLDPASDEGLLWISSLSLGGLSNYWTGAVPRFAPEDFADGARLDERFAWPVSYEDLAPWYDHVEAGMGLTAGDPIAGVPPGQALHRHQLPPDWSAVALAANERGHGVGALPMARGNPTMVALRNTEFSSYVSLTVPLEQRPDFRLLTGALVTHLCWSPTEGRVDGVAYLDRRTGRREVVRGRAVVLAAGTIDSTAIVLRSTSDDFPTGLGNSQDLVGRYLHDHPRVWWPMELRRSMSALSHPVYVAREAHPRSDPLMATSLTIGMTESLRDRLRTFYGGRTTDFGVQVLGTMVPAEDLGVRLGSWDGARPSIHLRYDSDARENLDLARDRVREVLGSAGLPVAAVGASEPPIPGESVHYAGSVRMHADRRHGVLDGWNRMHDVPNVAVVDPSCFTTGPEKNPTLTAMALAARAADRLAQDLAGGSLG